MNDAALIAARLCALDPALGGVLVRGRDAADVVADCWAGALAGPIKRVPVHIDATRLFGGIDLTATLAAGRPVAATGLLAEADGGALIVPMAERLPPEAAGALAAVLDTGTVASTHESVGVGTAPARLLILAIDEACEGEEQSVAPALADRLAFWIDPDAPPVPPLPRAAHPAADAAIDAEALAAIAATAAAFGITGMHAPLLAARAARAAARLAGRAATTTDDLMLAVQLVLAPRATCLPAPAEAEAVPDTAPPEPEDKPATDPGEVPPLDDLLIEAALAALPRDVLARLASAAGAASRGRRGKGAAQRRPSHGRPAGVRSGLPRGGARLALVDTLRAAVPWQRARGRTGPVRIIRDDLRVHRLKARAESLTIFAVDASGSSAHARLGEAKGAVELLLAEAYVKRAQVALVAFRGEGAELLLPPTRSLARAKKALAALPGGGGTPIAAGLQAAGALADAARRQGRTPYLVVLTDGRANIAGDGTADPVRAEAEAREAARAIAATGIGAALIDISPRPRAEGAAIAAAMQARYLPLPRGDARAVHQAITG